MQGYIIIYNTILPQLKEKGYIIYSAPLPLAPWMGAGAGVNAQVKTNNRAPQAPCNRASNAIKEWRFSAIIRKPKGGVHDLIKIAIERPFP